ALGLALGSAQPMVMSLLHSIAPAGRMGEAAGGAHVDHQCLDVCSASALWRRQHVAWLGARVLVGWRGTRERWVVRAARLVAPRRRCMFRIGLHRFSRSTNSLRNLATFGATTNWQ